MPAANVIGEVDQGFIYMMERLVTERIGAAVSNLAHARQILDETIAYAKERQAFGQPIGSFQANKHKLAELVTQCEVTQAFVDACVLQQLDEHPHRRWTPPRPSGGPPTCRTRCSTPACSCGAATAT